LLIKVLCLVLQVRVKTVSGWGEYLKPFSVTTGTSTGVRWCDTTYYDYVNSPQLIKVQY